MDFKSFGFSEAIMKGIEGMKYQSPTPIQEQAIPVVLDGGDVMGLAQTGTGKTAAFVLPILERLVAGKRGRIRALIVAPTRELAEQINENIESLGRHTGFVTLAVYGGVNAHHQIRKLKGGVDILVACPGRLLDLIGQRAVDLKGLEVLVIDEADRMFDMGFLPDIKRIMGHVPEKRQTLLFSATMPPDIQGLANKILTRPRRISVAFETPLDTITHAVYPVARHRKTELLLKLLGELSARSVLVFTRTKHRAKKLGTQLAESGYSAISLQGNLSQNRRQNALDGFRSGKYRIMVATDIAARGIDVSLISHVINYDLPDTADAYTHRIGRTGRAERKGEALTFVEHEEKSELIAIERQAGIMLECRTIPGFDEEPACEHGRSTPVGNPAGLSTIGQGGKRSSGNSRRFGRRPMLGRRPA